MFGIKKPFYLDKNGNTYCAGDDCKHECNERCPVWLNTLATTARNHQQPDRAIFYYKKALEILPKETSYLNNMGFCYGTMEMYEEAEQAFLKSYRINRNKMSIKGLAMIYKDLGDYDTSLKYINEYDSKYFDHELDNIRRIVTSEEQNSENNGSKYDPDMDATLKLLDAFKENIIKDSTISPMEINSSRWMTIDLLTQIEIYNNNGDDKFDILSSLSWAIYAGIGLRLLLKKGLHNDKEKVIDELLKPRGIFVMDEYIIEELCGYPFNSKEGERIAITVYLWSKQFEKLYQGTTKFYNELFCVAIIFGNIMTEDIISGNRFRV